jgi:hypothetical protein
VSPVGTDTENGQALIDAMDTIADASASKPYLVHIEPATYDLGNSFGNSFLIMKPWVDIEGSGELNTVITSGSALDDGCIGTAIGADNAEMRFLTVRHTGSGVCSWAIATVNASPRLTHLTAESTGGVSGGGSDFPAHVGVYSNNSSPTMTDVTASASGASGVLIGNAGVYITGSSNATIRDSKLSGSGGTQTSALRVDVESGTTKVALSQLVGGVSNLGSPGTLQCFNNYNENLAAVTC